MDTKQNFKKLLCYNIVNNCKCAYKNKCMFAHTLDEQIKEPMRQYIHNMLYKWDDLSEINLNEEKALLNELIILTKECKNCMGKKCPGGYNCKFGVCLRENKICYNDLMYGKCYNMLMETNENNNVLYKCIHGIHLSEKKLIPYNQRMLTDLTNIETNFLMRHNVLLNSKNNIISLCLNDNTITIVKDIITNKLNKSEIINNLKSMNNLFVNCNKSSSDVDLYDDNIFDDILKEINNDEINDNDNKIDDLSENNLTNAESKNKAEKNTVNINVINDINNENDTNNVNNVNNENNIINNVIVYDDDGEIENYDFQKNNLCIRNSILSINCDKNN